MKIEDCLLKDFINLSENEKFMILKWRNHNNIRLWMYNQNIIDKESHLNFINKLKNDNNNKYFLVTKKNKNLGVIYFNNIDYERKECEFGLYTNPFEKIKGTGSILLEIVIKYAFNILHMKKIKLKVFVDNEKAINLYEKFKFKEICKKMVNNKEVIYMELSNENRKF